MFIIKFYSRHVLLDSSLLHRCPLVPERLKLQDALQPTVAQSSDWGFDTEVVDKILINHNNYIIQRYAKVQFDLPVLFLAIGPVLSVHLNKFVHLGKGKFQLGTSLKSFKSSQPTQS